MYGLSILIYAIMSPMDFYRGIFMSRECLKIYGGEELCTVSRKSRMKM